MKKHFIKRDDLPFLNNLLQVMRVFLLLFFIGISPIFAETYSQEARFSLQLNDVSLEDLFSTIEKNSEYLFLYKENVPVNARVSVKAQDQTLGEILDEVLTPRNIQYRINDRQVIVAAKRSNPKIHELSAPVILQQARKTVTGKVRDVAGEPVIGANIFEKGTTNGVISDIDGNFSLQVDPDATIVVSYIGFQSREIVVGNQSTLQITLAENLQELEDVVVIGYGTVRKSDLTGAVASVSSKQFKDQPVKQVADILQGRTAGVEVTSLSGMPGSSVKVRIRGTTSINKSSDPLYIVDGIVSTNGLDGLNPSDIQSLEALKDASATAIYGSRGANGVILVTTRKGEEGKTQITADVAIGVSSIIKKYDMLSAYEYALALNDIWGSSTVSAADVEAYKNGSKGIDWQDIMTQTGISQDYKLSISGGSAKNRYLVSGNLLDMSAVTITTKYQRAQLRVNLDNEVTPWLTISSKLNGSRMHAHNNSVDLALNYSPAMEMKDEATGIYNRDPYNSIGGNPYGNRMLNYDDKYSYNVNGNLNLLFKIIDGLTLSVQGGGNYYHAPEYGFSSSQIETGARNGMSNGSVMNLYWQNTNNLTYQKKFGDHKVTATAVWETSNVQKTGLAITGSDLSNESVGYWNYVNAANRNGSNEYSAEAIASGIGRLFYSYKDRYLMTVTFRADGSSKFQGDNKWGYFPSGSLAWDVAKEEFMSSQELLQQLKIRTSFGITGNQDIGRYSTLGMLSPTSYGWGTTTPYTGYLSSSFPTPNVRWEKTYQYDLGADVSLLDSRLNVSMDWFLKNTKDLLFQKTIPAYNGGGTYWVNQGEIKNTGVELSINAIPVNRKELTWESTLNASYVKNEIIDLAGQDFILDANQSDWGGAMQIMKPGYPLGSFYLYKWEGFDDAGANLYKKADGTLTTQPAGEDQIIKGQANPKWTIGWNNMVSWKNWEASILFSAVTGFSRLNVGRFYMASMTGPSRFITLRESYYSGWDKVANKADAKYGSHTNSNNKVYGNSDFWLEDASFLKVRNISIAYRIPKKVVKIADIQLSVSAQNLLVLTKYTGMDPEVYNAYTGLDNGSYPVPRTFTIGAKFNF
jgi:TonB-linked SusC/RagA family outer membrane protein